MKIKDVEAELERWIDAAENGDIAAMKEIMSKNKIDIEIEEDCFGAPALVMAAANGKTESVAFLLDAGADIDHCDDHGNTALISAVAAGKIDTAKLLAERGADLLLRNEYGDTALDMADDEHYDEILDILLEVDKYRHGDKTGIER